MKHKKFKKSSRDLFCYACVINLECQTAYTSNLPNVYNPYKKICQKLNTSLNIFFYTIAFYVG